MKFSTEHGGYIIDSYGTASTSTLFLVTRRRKGEWGLVPGPDMRDSAIEWRMDERNKYNTSTS